MITSPQKIESECSPSRKDAFREGVCHGLAIPSVVIFATMLGYGSLSMQARFSAFGAPSIDGTRLGNARAGGDGGSALGRRSLGNLNGRFDGQRPFLANGNDPCWNFSRCCKASA